MRLQWISMSLENKSKNPFVYTAFKWIINYSLLDYKLTLVISLLELTVTKIRNNSNN